MTDEDLKFIQLYQSTLSVLASQNGFLPLLTQTHGRASVLQGYLDLQSPTSDLKKQVEATSSSSADVLACMQALQGNYKNAIFNNVITNYPFMVNNMEGDPSHTVLKNIFTTAEQRRVLDQTYESYYSLPAQLMSPIPEDNDDEKTHVSNHAEFNIRETNILSLYEASLKKLANSTKDLIEITAGNVVVLNEYVKTPIDLASLGALERRQNIYSRYENSLFENVIANYSNFVKDNSDRESHHQALTQIFSSEAQQKSLEQAYEDRYLRQVAPNSSRMRR